MREMADQAPEYQCGIDIGGTFTDCVVLDSAGAITVAKASSTPDDFSRGFFDSLTEGAKTRGLTLDQLLADSSLVFHGATVATNAIVQRRGSKVGLIATRGHGDAMLIMRGRGRTVGLSPGEVLHASQTYKPDPLIPRSLIREVDER